MRKIKLLQICAVLVTSLFAFNDGLFAQYCLPTYSSPCSSGDFIDLVSFATINNNSTGCNGGSPNNYIDNTATISTTVATGSSHTLSVRPGPNWGQYFIAFIDYNQDLDFADPGEFINIGYAAAGVTISTTVTIPLNATPGTTRMRVLCRYGTTTLGAGDYCSPTLNYGETEDYGLIIQGPAPINAGLVNMMSPSSGCGLSATENVTVRYSNAGTDTMNTYSLCYTINGGTPVCETVNAQLAPGDTTQYTFSTQADLSIPGIYNFDLSINLTGDTVNANDNLTGISINSIPLVNTFPYIERFANGTGGWTTGGTFNTWALGTPAKTTINSAASDANSWTIGGLSGTYDNNTSAWVLSPCLDFTTNANPYISMSVWWNAEFSWDGAVLESTTDGGTTWSQVGAFGDPNNWYTDNSISGLPNGEGWSGRVSTSNGSAGWVTAQHKLDGLAGAPSVRLRVLFGSDGSVVDDGFAFDDVIIADVVPVNLGPDTTECYSYTLAPQASGTFNWSTGDSTSTLLVGSSGTYSLSLTDSLGFTTMDTVSLTIIQGTPVDAGLDQQVCVGNQACLAVDSLGLTAVLWSNGATTPSNCVTVAGTYNVTATDTNGCVSMDSVMVTNFATTVVDLGQDTTLCAGQTLCLDAGAGATMYQWSNGDSSQTICVTQAMSYSVVVTDGNGCEASDSIGVTGVTAPSAMALADTAGCPVVQFTDMSTGDAISWAWDFGDGNTSTAQSPSHDYTSAGNGSYTATLVVTNACGVDSMSVSFEISCVVGIENAWARSLNVYPNPNNGLFNVVMNLESAESIKLEVMNLQGQMVHNESILANQGTFNHEIKLSAVAAGTYFLRITAGDRQITKKLFVE